MMELKEVSESERESVPVKKDSKKTSKLSTPISESSTIQSQNLTKYNCVMNKQKLFKQDVFYMVYSCSTCPGKLEDICQDCIENCHKNHNRNSKNIVGKRVSLSEVLCTCAMNNHMVKASNEKEIKDVRIDTTEVSCDLNSILNKTNSKYYYIDNTNNSYYCLFCMKFCRGKIDENNLSSLKENFTSREVSKFSTPPKCYCNNRECHSSFIDNITCIQMLLIADVFDNFYNKSLLPFQIINNKDIRNKLFGPLLEQFKLLADKIYSNDYSYFQLNQLSKDCVSSLSLLISIASSYEREKILMDHNLEIIYSFQFLKLLFTTEERRGDCLVEIKIQSLQLFRNLYLIPNIKYNNIKYIENFMMTNSLHRILITKHISDFFKSIQIDEKSFLEFIETVGNSIVDYTYKIDDQFHGNLILEYLEIIS